MITEFDCKSGNISIRRETIAEIAEMERLQAEMPEPEPTLPALDERIADLEEAMYMILEGETM